MKRILFICFTFLINLALAQDLVIKELLPPESKEYSDLSFLKEELRNKNLVLLGEMTHQYGNIFEMKARIVEYLHKEMGFTTIAIESSMYDLWLMYKNNGFNASEFNNAVFGVWSNTIEFQRLVHYIEENNIRIIGFDTQIANTDQFIDDFFDYYEDQNIKIKLDEEDMAIVLEGLLNEYAYEEYDIKFKDFEKELERLIKASKVIHKTADNYYWHQFTKNVLSIASDAYYNKEAILSTDFVNIQHNYRDQQMADNILGYLERNKQEKVVVWADNVHIIKDMTSITKPIAKDFVPMGYHLTEQLGDRLYSLATLHANDSIVQKGNWYSTPIEQASFEQLLTSLDKEYAFISADQEFLKKPWSHRLLSNVNFTSGRLDQMHDGYIFLRKATVPKITMNVIEETSKKEITETSKVAVRKTMFTKQEGITLLKSRVIDADTNLPVVYANVILKNEEIYRITDEQGYFEIPITDKVTSKSIVSISSMGFNSQHIPFKELNDTVILKPSVESLDAVQIVAHITPKSVLKKAIKQIKINHPNTSFNYNRYSNITINQNDMNLLHMNLITAEYDQGYRQLNRLTQRVDQVQWNTNLFGKKLKNTNQLFRYRQNALRYANIVHRRKYKKFDLKFIKSKDAKDEEFYVIEFKTHRNNWNYTNRGYPIEYSGRIYIHRENFAITKVIENWETSLSGSEIVEYEDYMRPYTSLKDIKMIKLKEENICVYTKNTDEKYYASEFFTRSYSEYTDSKGQRTNYTYELNSKVFDLKTDHVEIIDYDPYNEDESRLNRVGFNQEFWDSFLSE